MIPLKIVRENFLVFYTFSLDMVFSPQLSIRRPTEPIFLRMYKIVAVSQQHPWGEWWWRDFFFSFAGSSILLMVSLTFPCGMFYLPQILILYSLCYLKPFLLSSQVCISLTGHCGVFVPLGLQCHSVPCLLPPCTPRHGILGSHCHRTTLVLL